MKRSILELSNHKIRRDFQRSSLLIHPSFNRTLIGQNFTFSKPQGNFFLGALNRVTAMTNITTNILRHQYTMTRERYDCVVTTDGPWSRGEGVGCTEHGFELEIVLLGEGTATGFDNVFALPDHCDDGAGVHV